MLHQTRRKNPLVYKGLRAASLKLHLAGSYENDNFDTPPSTVLPVMSDSEVMFCLQVIRDLESKNHLY